jgi:uncharacterized protein YegL
MPRLNADALEQHTIAGSFAFTGARIANLGATEYTLVDIELDMTGSVTPFRAELIDMLKTAIDACKKSPRSDNLLVRVAAFSSVFANGSLEIHGYIPLLDIDLADYDQLQPGGGTPLFDACFMGVGSMNAYAKLLADQEFNANGITFVITDGDDTCSTTTPKMIADEVEKAIKSEALESHVSILIGINAGQLQHKLQAFQRDAKFTQFIDAGDANKGRLAKLAAFVSQSISSTSQALGTGGPSQNIAPVI